jgi:hypothetical protein
LSLQTVHSPSLTTISPSAVWVWTPVSTSTRAPLVCCYRSCCPLASTNLSSGEDCSRGRQRHDGL